MSLDLSTWELHNLVSQAGVLRVRPGFTQQYAPTAGTKIVYGFSLPSPDSGEIYHYLVERLSSTGQSTLKMLTEEWFVLTTVDIGHLKPKPIFTYGVQNDQLIINSPDISNPIYGIVGGGLAEVISITSVNDINTPTLPNVPRGLVCAWSDRLPITEAKDCFFNDAGSEIRSYVSENVVALQGIIYGLFEGPASALHFITPNGIYGLPVDAASFGQEVFGQLSKVSAYSANQYRNVCYSSGEIWALTKTGVSLLTSGIDLELTDNHARRYYSAAVGPNSSGSYQDGQIWPTRAGVAISFNRRICLIDAADRKPRWYYSNNDLTIVGICSSLEGQELFVFPDRVCELIGNQEFDSVEIRGAAIGTADIAPPSASPVLKAITTISDGVGQEQAAYFGGELRSATTPAPTRAHNIIGTDSWSATNRYVAAEKRSRRHHFPHFRTDDLAGEISIVGSGNSLGVIDVELINKGGNRE